MRIFRLLALALLTLGFALSVEAAPFPVVNVGLQDVVDTLEQSYRNLGSVTADFFQRSTLVEKQREMRADGQFYLKLQQVGGADSPKVMFRFDYFRPTRHEIVCDGSTLWTYLPENRQVIQSDVREAFNPLSLDNSGRANNFLQGLGRISRDFQITFASQMQDPAGNYLLELTPRRATAAIERLFLVVSRDAVINYVQNQRKIARALSSLGNRQELAFPLLSSTMRDHRGNSSTLEFSNIKANAMLADMLFNFAVPGGVQVVRPPR